MIFLAKRKDFKLVSNSLLPDNWITSNGFMFAFPNITKSDGLFCSRVTKGQLNINFKYYLLCLSAIITICVFLADFLVMPFTLDMARVGIWLM